jgi:Transposase C of IS166 homeodomain
MTSASESLPSDLAGAHAMILGERAARVEAERKLVDARAEAANAQADLSSTQALISYLKLEIEKLRRQLYGTRSERKARLLEQMELQLEELEATATEDELSAEQADADRKILPAQAAFSQTVPGSSAARTRRHPGAGELPVLRVEEAGEAGRGHHRDAGGDPAPVEGDPDGAREVLVPGVRDDHAAAGAVPCDATRLCRPQPAGHGPVREVRPASAV